MRTTGELNNGTLIFKKESMTSRKMTPHLSNMSVIKKAFDKKGEGNLFADIRLSNGCVYMDKVDGIELEDAIVDSILAGDEKETNKLLDTYESIISSISVKLKNIKSKKFPGVFGGKLEEYFDTKKVIYPGVIDLNFDNIIIGKDGPKIIDYEWSFNECVPADYVLYRAIMWLSIRYSHLFKLNSRKIKFMSISDDMLLPKFIFDRYKNLLTHLQNSYDLERNYFQPWANPDTIKEIKIELKEYSGSLKFSLDDLVEAKHSISSLNERIKLVLSEKESLKEGAVELEVYINLLKKEIDKKEKMNSTILNSRSYKLARAMSSPVRLLRRIVKK